MRIVADIIESGDYANGGDVIINWEDWQTLKSALAQQTNNKQSMPCEIGVYDEPCKLGYPCKCKHGCLIKRTAYVS